MTIAFQYLKIELFDGFFQEIFYQSEKKFNIIRNPSNCIQLDIECQNVYDRNCYLVRINVDEMMVSKSLSSCDNLARRKIEQLNESRRSLLPMWLENRIICLNLEVLRKT